MDSMGSDFNITGSVMTKAELEEIRKKRGECVTCGQKCFRKKLFKMVPLDITGKVINGRCLNCHPIQPKDVHVQSAAVAVMSSRRTSRSDLERFSRSQSNLGSSSRNLTRSPSSGLVGGVVGGGQGQGNTNSSSNSVSGRRRGTRTAPVRTASNTSNPQSTLPTAPTTPTLPSRTTTNMGMGIRAPSTRSMESTGSYSVQSQQRGLVAANTSAVAATPVIRTPSSSSSRHFDISIQDDQHGHERTPSSSRRRETSQDLPVEIPTLIQQQQRDSTANSALSGLSQSATPVQNESKRNSSKSATGTTSSTATAQDRAASFKSSESRSYYSHSSSGDDDGGRNSNDDDDWNTAAQRDGSQPLPLPPPPTSRNRSGENVNSKAVSSPRNIQAPSPSSASSSRRRKSAAAAASGRPLPTTSSLCPPSADELQRARETLLAAQQHGMLDGGDKPLLSTQHNDSDPSLNSNVSHGGAPIRSQREYFQTPVDHHEYDLDLPDPDADLDEAGYDHDDDVEDGGFDLTFPVHGVLNRGGAFPPVSSPVTPSSENRGADIGRSPLIRQQQVVDGSSRTLSSMSSIDEEEQDSDQDRHRTRADHINVGGNFENNASSLGRRNIDGHTATSLNVDDPLEVSESNESFTVSAIDQTRRAQQEFSSSEKDLVRRIDNARDDYEEIVSILQQAQDSTVVAREALAAIGSIPFGENEHDHLAEINAPLVVVESMHWHKVDVEVQLWGLGAMQQMTGTLTNQLAFVDVGAVDVVFHAMRRFSSHEDLQVKALAALVNLAAAQENCDVFLKKGVVERLRASMEQHSPTPLVLVKGCAMIANLASHDPAFKEQIVGLGEPVANVMAIHAEDPTVQEKGLRALRSLCAESSRNKIALEECYGVIDITIAAMQFHRDEAGVQAEGAWALANLAGNDDNNDIIGDSGGIDVIVRAMWVHSENKAVLEQCAKGLLVLSSCQQNRSIMLEVDGDTAVINAMMGHAESVSFQELCCAILASLCQDSDEIKIRVVDKECLDATAMAMVSHQEDDQLQAAACDLLCVLAVEENYDAVIAAQVVHLVQLASERFPEHCRVPPDSLIAKWIAQSQERME